MTGPFDDWLRARWSLPAEWPVKAGYWTLWLNLEAEAVLTVVQE